ncbi:MAG TPA: phage tail protein [Rhizomicrobium sp.]
MSATVTEIIGTVALTAASIGLSAALAPSVPDPQAGKQPVKQPIPYANVGYGRARIAGAFMLDEVTANILERVFAFHQGQIDGYEQWYLNDDKVRLYETGAVIPLKDGSYSSDDWNYGRIYGTDPLLPIINLLGLNAVDPTTAPVIIQTRLGLATETAYSDLATELPAAWSTSCRGDGIASYWIRVRSGGLSIYPKQFPNGKPSPSVAARLSLVYDWRDGSQSKDDASTWAWSDNPIVCWVNDLWRKWDYDWDKCFAPTLDILTVSADVCDEDVPVKGLLAVVQADASHGDTSFQLSKAAGLHAGMMVNLAPNQDNAETVTVASVSGTSSPFTINISGTLAHSHAMYEHVTWLSDPTNPATEKRYTCNGYYTGGNQLSDVVLQFRTCCDGWMCRNGQGAVIIKAGRYEEPTVTLTADDIIDYAWSSYVVDEQACNQLNVSYCAPEFDYNQVDTDPWNDEEDIVQRGATRAQSFYPQWCQQNSQARRLAKRALAKLLAGSGTIRTKLSGMDGIGERYIRVQAGPNEIDELDDVVVEVTGDPEIAEDGLSIVFTVTAADPNVDAWNYLTEEGGGPSTVDRVEGEQLDAPTITSSSAMFDTTGTGDTQGVRIEIDATGPDRNDLTWSARWRKTGAVSWVEASYPSITAYPDVVIDTDFVPADASIEVEVAYLTGAGSLSDWSPTTTVSTSTSNVAPGAPSDVTESVSGTDATIGWRNPTSSNFAAARVWRAAHGAGFGAAADVSGAEPGPLGGTGSYLDAGLTSGAYDYWVTAENSAGTPSGHTGPVTVTI